ncbi:MAG: PHP domain-containing protein [Desulfobacteraceae bacterium]|nr:MAG: PHP domain-containing protein [Desulfobacteraceae bacterium]
MIILNSEKEDYHVHSLNFSDGMNTIDELVRFSGEIGMKKLAIADHSQAALNALGWSKKNPREVLKRWKNIYNEVEVLFGVEADLLNEQGDICAHIQGFQGDFTILSYHPNVYRGDKKKLSEAYLRAIEKHHAILSVIGHLYVNCQGVDIAAVIASANTHHIPLELNCFYLISKRDLDENALNLVLEQADQIYVNSDAHTLAELKESRKQGFRYLEQIQGEWTGQGLKV